jgi:hypothetical protein
VTALSTSAVVGFGCAVLSALGTNLAFLYKHHDGKSMWRGMTKTLKSVGSYEVRYTRFYSTLFA